MPTFPTDETPHPAWMLPMEPGDISGLVAFWEFRESAETFVAQQGESYTLRSQCGKLEVIADPAAGATGRALTLREGQWLAIPRRDCPKLDIHGKEGHFSLMVRIKRGRTEFPQCEFIAGQWNETHLSRQYGLFLNIRVWGQHDRIFGHLSPKGGPTPGYKYCMDGCMGSTEIPQDEWVTVAMSYDGVSGSAWLNGVLDAHPRFNPYSLAGGLHDGGPNGSDFTVGAVSRSGEIGNFFCGQIAALAVYNRALTPAEMLSLNRRLSAQTPESPTP